jgi:hypothetical protein
MRSLLQNVFAKIGMRCHSYLRGVTWGQARIFLNVQTSKKEIDHGSFIQQHASPDVANGAGELEVKYVTSLWLVSKRSDNVNQG